MGQQRCSQWEQGCYLLLHCLNPSFSLEDLYGETKFKPHPRGIRSPKNVSFYTISWLSPDCFLHVHITAEHHGNPNCFWNNNKKKNRNAIELQLRAICFTGTLYSAKTCHKNLARSSCSQHHHVNLEPLPQLQESSSGFVPAPSF